MSLLTRSRRFSGATLVLCIDVGTTFTAASYCLIQDKKDPGVFQEVNRWPKQRYPDAKIPSAILYDQKGQARLHGAEIEDTACMFEAEEGGWVKAEWWKLHLRPEYLPLPQGFITKPLPPLVTLDKAFEDLFIYVMKNVQAFMAKAYGDPTGKLWASLSSSMVVVLTAPNGWEGQQQNRMRNAAIKAGLISSARKDRLRFVSEGEAAVHYCLEQVPAIHNLKIGSVVLVCDAGGGTTDIGVYKIVRLGPLFLEEILSPRCIVTGGVYVDFAANKLIKSRLEGSRWGTKEIISKVTRAFEKEGKRGLRAEESIYLDMSESGESDRARGIIRGRFMITKEEMTLLFEPSINRLLNGLADVFRESTHSINQVFVVGGFAESDYVYNKIAKYVQTYHTIPTAKPDGPLSKAIAHGGLRWHFESSVQFRITRLHYGAETDVPYDENNREMAGRAKYKNLRGQWRVRHAWKGIVSKNARIRSGQEHRESFHRDVGEKDDLDVEMELYAYRLEQPPMFFKDKSGKLVDGFVHLGTVKGNLAKCYDALKFRNTIGQDKKPFKSLEYDVGITFGDIELSATLHWKEKGSSVSGGAVIVYDM